MNYYSGHNNEWLWLEANADDFNFSDVKRYSPESVIDHFVAIRSFDSCLLTWSDEETGMGFTYVNGIPTTNIIQDLSTLPIGEYDEWYLFKELKEFTIQQTFINYAGFSLANKEFDQHLVREFWKQLDFANPSKFMAQNGKFIFITKIQPEFERIKNACQQKL